MPLRHPFTGKRLHGLQRSLDMGQVARATHNASNEAFSEKFIHPRHLRRNKSIKP